MSQLSMNLAQARAAWCRHQGLAAPGASVAQVIGSTGWIRTLGGVDGYLALRARLPALSVQALHAAVEARELQVLPAARGCIYVVPREQGALALSLARDLSARTGARVQQKAGVVAGELQQLGLAVVEALGEGALGTAALRKALPAGAVRSLGEQGKKVGVTSTLPPALRRLEFAGRIYRRPVQGRLDHERYLWRLSGSVEVDERPAEERYADVVRLVVGWFAPSTITEISEFTGLGKRVVRAAVQAAGAVPVAVEEHAAEAFILPEQLDRLHEPAPGGACLLPGLDNLLTWHGGPRHFVHPADLERPVAPWGPRRGGTWSSVKHALTRVVLAEGRVSGLWEYDPDSGEVVVGPYTSGLPAGAPPEAERVATFLREQVGHGRAFSRDKDEHLRRRAELVRALG